MKELFDKEFIPRFDKFRQLIQQKATEGGVAIGASPNVRVSLHAHVHPVPLLQLQGHSIATVISCIYGGCVVRGAGHAPAVLVKVEASILGPASVIEKREEVHTCSRRCEDTCRFNRALDFHYFIYLQQICL